MTTRDRTVLGVLAIVAILAGFWFMLLNPRREEAKSLTDKVAAAQQRLDTARQVAADAEHARQRYDADYATVARLGKAVPVDDDVPSLVFQLEHAADGSRVDFRSIKLAGGSSPAAPVAQTNAAAATAVAQAEKAPSNSSDPNATPAAQTATPAPATQMAAAALPPGASVGTGGFPTMPFDFSFTGSFFRLEGFLKALDRFTTVKGDLIDVRGRLLTVDGIALSASAKGFPSMSAKIHATAYLLPSDQGLTNGATPTAPATTPGATPAGSTAPSNPPTPTAAVTGGTP